MVPARIDCGEQRTVAQGDERWDAEILAGARTGQEGLSDRAARSGLRVRSHDRRLLDLLIEHEVEAGLAYDPRTGAGVIERRVMRLVALFKSDGKRIGTRLLDLEHLLAVARHDGMLRKVQIPAALRIGLNRVAALNGRNGPLMRTGARILRNLAINGSKRGLNGFRSTLIELVITV